MKYEKIAPSFVYFLSGIGAATAVNFLTSIPLSDFNRSQSIVLMALSLPWIFLSFTLAWIAVSLEEGRSKLDRLPIDKLQETEITELRFEIYSDVRTKLNILLILALFLFLVGASSVSLTNLSFFGEVPEDDMSFEENDLDESNDSVKSVVDK